jgi:hypothetical protein
LQQLFGSNGEIKAPDDSYDSIRAFALIGEKIFIHESIKKEALTAVKASEKLVWTVLVTPEHRLRAAALPSQVRHFLMDSPNG